MMCLYEIILIKLRATRFVLVEVTRVTTSEFITMFHSTQRNMSVCNGQRLSSTLSYHWIDHFRPNLLLRKKENKWIVIIVR